MADDRASAPGPGVEADDRLRRWRLVLGAEAPGELEGRDAAIDAALAALYEPKLTGAGRRGGLGASAPGVARWLGDIRSYFPSAVVQVMQRDAIERLDLHELLLEPELLESVTPDIHLVTTLLALRDALPESARHTARAVVRRVVDELERRLADRARQAVAGALDRSARSRRPKLRDVDWNRTVLANLRHYQPEYRTVVPERLVGFARRRRSLGKELVLCVDQSGSMATSVVHAGVLGSALASLPALSLRFVAFDTSVVDLTDDLDDPVDLLFGVQLGGGTDIDQALAYCERIVSRPLETVLVLVTDLYEGGNPRSMLRRAAALLGAGVQVIVLLALSDDGAPAYDHANAQHLASLGAPVFACTPDLFPDLMAAAIERRDVSQWAARHDVAVTPAVEERA